MRFCYLVSWKSQKVNIKFGGVKKNVYLRTQKLKIHAKVVR